MWELLGLVSIWFYKYLLLVFFGRTDELRIQQFVLSGTEQNAAALQRPAQISLAIKRHTKVEEIYIEQR